MKKFKIALFAILMAGVFFGFHSNKAESKIVNSSSNRSKIVANVGHVASYKLCPQAGDGANIIRCCSDATSPYCWYSAYPVVGVTRIADPDLVEPFYKYQITYGDSAGFGGSCGPCLPKGVDIVFTNAAMSTNPVDWN